MEQVPDQVRKIEQRRQDMPCVAAFIDICRDTYGAEWVDQQMAIAQQARRDHVEILAQLGEVAAKRWHRVNASRCTFFAQEGGRTLGLPLPTTTEA